MNHDLLKSAGRARAFVDAPKIEGASHAKRAHDVDVGSGEMAEMIGAEHPPPAQGTAIARGIAAEIAEIAGALQVEMAGRSVWHRSHLSRGISRRHDICLMLPRAAPLVYSRASRRQYEAIKDFFEGFDGSCGSRRCAGLCAEFPDLPLRRRNGIHRRFLPL